MKDLDQAIHDTADGYGIRELSKLVNVREGTFYNQTNIKQEGHTINIHTARAMMLATKDYQILDSLAHEVGRVCSPIPDHTDLSDLALLDVILSANKEHGEVSQVINKALDDGQISEQDSRDIEHEIMDAIKVLMGLNDKIKSMVTK